MVLLLEYVFFSTLSTTDEMIKATARAGAFVCARACAMSTRPCLRLFVSHLALK